MKILVVDDNEKNLKFIDGVLRKENYEVRLCSSGKDAIESVKSADFDLFLIDVVMPHPDGYELTNFFKSDERLSSIPLILMSSIKTEVKDVVAGLSRGADEYIRKPIDQEELLARVRSTLRKKQLEEARIEVKRLHAIHEISLTLMDKLNNPLSVVIGKIQVLLSKRKNLDSELIEILKSIEQTAYEMSQILEKVSKIRSIKTEEIAGFKIIDIDNIKD